MQHATTKEHAKHHMPRMRAKGEEMTTDPDNIVKIMVITIIVLSVMWWVVFNKRVNK